LWPALPGEDCVSKQGLAACDSPGLLAVLDRLRQRADVRCCRPVAIVVTREASRDGFWAELAKKASSAQPIEAQRRVITYWKRDVLRLAPTLVSPQI